jgi:hypothetical protein
VILSENHVRAPRRSLYPAPLTENGSDPLYNGVRAPVQPLTGCMLQTGPFPTGRVHAFISTALLNEAGRIFEQDISTSHTLLWYRLISKERPRPLAGSTTKCATTLPPRSFVDNPRLPNSVITFKSRSMNRLIVPLYSKQC